MKKYLQLIRLTLQEHLIYRLNFVLWRFRSIVFFLTLFFFWQAVYGGHEELFGYQKSQMITYIIGIALLKSIVFSSRSADMAGMIKNGDLTKIIITPIGLFRYWISRDSADKLLNTGFTVIELLIIVIFFKIPFFMPVDPISIIGFVLIVFLAILLYFFISIGLSITSFWTDEVWAMRWLFGVIFLEFFAGTFFPIDVLPKWLSEIINLTPFPYLAFYPIKIWLGQITGFAMIEAILICFIWLLIFFILVQYLWRKGVKNYGAYGG